MSQGVDTERGLLDEEDAQNACVDEAAEPVTPAQTCDNHGEDETHYEDDLEVVLVLPDDDWVLIQIANVGAANSFWVLLHQHPAEVAVEQSLSYRVRVFVGVGVAVVRTVVTSP